MPPELIKGRYRVVRSVGRGGMGEVWLCRDETLGRDVAIKTVGRLPGESLTDSARAMREARSSAALSHRNVVSVFDVVEDADQIWLVMEYVPSRTLSEILREDGPLSPRRAARIGAQAADGLAAAHAAGTIHRDVKPGNILVGEDDVAKISDFGIARMTGDAQLTQTGMLTGTPTYFAPELARGQDPGPASDVWALGATLYAAVEGTPPYPEQRNALALLQTIASEPPPRPMHAGPLTGPITRMMDRDPGARWSMLDVASALHHIAAPDTAGSPVEVDSPTTTLDMSDEAPPASRIIAAPPPQEHQRGKALPWVLAVLLLLAVAGGGYLLLRPNDETSSPSADAGADRSTPRGASSSPSQPASEAPSPQTTPETTAAPPSKTPAPPSKTPAPPPADDDGDEDEAKAEFLESYYDAVPDDTDAGWAGLAPSMQAQGRERYDAFWSGIDSVSVSDIRPVTGEPVAELVLTYDFADGRRVVERQRVTLQESGNGYLLADDEVLSSRTTES